MKVSCVQENLSKGLGIVGRAVATRTTLPISNKVLIATEDSRLRLTATNLEIAISCWIGAMVEEEGAITVPARVLSEFINSLPSERIDLHLVRQSLELKCLRFEARIQRTGCPRLPPHPQGGRRQDLPDRSPESTCRPISLKRSLDITTGPIRIS